MTSFRRVPRDVVIALVVFAMSLLALAIASYIGWDRWTVSP